MTISDSTTLNELNDEQLLQYLNTAKHRDVLNELYDRFEKRIFFKCISMLKNKEEAKDLTHDIFITIFTKLGQFKGNSALSLWIHTISVNSCLKYLEKKKRIQVISHEKEHAESISDDSIDQIQEKQMLELQIQDLDRLLLEIKEEERLMIIMKYVDGLSIKEMSTILKLGESAVKMKLKRSRDKLYNLFTTQSKFDENV